MAEPSFVTHLVSCDGGLNTQASTLFLGRPDNNGIAATLINFEPWKGYRRLTGITQFGDSTGVAVYAGAVVRGVAVFNNTVIQARDTSTSLYALYYRSTSATTWTSFATGLSYSADFRVRHVKFGWSGEKIAFVDGNNPARTWDGAAVVVLNGGGAPVNPSLVASFSNRLALSGYSSKPYAVTLSAPNDETQFSSGAAIEINCGDTVKQIKEFRQDLIIFCETSIKRITGTSSADFKVEPVTTDMGCIAPDSVFELGGDLYFWSGDGLRTIKGSMNTVTGDFEMGTVTIPIRPTITLRATQFDPTKLVNVIVRAKTQFRLFFSTASLNTSVLESRARGFLGALHQDPVVPGKDGFRLNFGEIFGLNPSCCASGYISGTEYVVHGGYDGNVYRQESGTTFAGRNISAIYKTPYMDLADPFVRKTLYRLMTYLSIEGNATIYIGLNFDFDDPNVTQPTDIQETVSYASAIYGDPLALYGDSATVYGARLYPMLQDAIRGSCKNVQITIVSLDDQASVAIQGFALEYANEGRS